MEPAPPGGTIKYDYTNILNNNHYYTSCINRV